MLRRRLWVDSAPRADRGLGLDHLFAPRQVLGKRADVAYRRPAGSIHLALGHGIIVGGPWRRGGPDGQIREIERELIVSVARENGSEKLLIGPGCGALSSQQTR